MIEPIRKVQTVLPFRPDFWSFGEEGRNSARFSPPLFVLVRFFMEARIFQSFVPNPTSACMRYQNTSPCHVKTP